MSTLASPSAQEQQFLEAFQQAIDTQKLDRVVLSQYKGELEQLEKITLRIIQLNQEQVLSCLYRHKTQDITKNYPLAEAQIQLSHLLADCKQANLFTTDQEIQLKKNKKKAMLSISKTAPTIAKPKEPKDMTEKSSVMSINPAHFYNTWGLAMPKRKLFRAWRVNGNRLINSLKFFRGLWRKSKFRKILCAWWILVQAKAI